MAEQSVLALHQHFMVHGDVLEWVEVFRYLGCLLSQDGNDIQAVQSQLCKARGMWTRVGQVLHIEEFASTGDHQVIQGHRAICPLVWKQDMGPEPGCHGQTQGIPHPRGI